jgi:hypothetical protein
MSAAHRHTARCHRPPPARPSWMDTPRTLDEVRANVANHIMCDACWDKGWAEATERFVRKGRKRRRYWKPAARRHSFGCIAGPCCYCGGRTDDGIPYGTGNDALEICGGEHGRWTASEVR